MSWSLVLIPLLPLAAALLSLVPLGTRWPRAITVAAAVAALVLSAVNASGVAAAGRVIAIPRWVELDGLGAVLALLVTFVSSTAAIFSWGYLTAHEYSVARVRSYCVHFNLFVFALALVPVLEEPALAWIAIEFTAVFSVLLVAFENTHGALEAAWKYIALMFMGAAIALFGFFVLYWAQARVGGGHYSWAELRAVAPALSPILVTTAFVAILVGFGTKVGFVPLHTWLPDAHSQAPAPVCALLSGVKTTAALYCILRLVPLLPAGEASGWLLPIGLLSVGVAAFLLLQVRDYKRMFAYSTVEHMGIIAVAIGLGGPAGLSAGTLQMISHSLTKSFCFLAAGAALLVLGIREIAPVRGLLRTSPVAGSALLFGALAIGGAPPFAVFLSEFAVFRAGFAQGYYVVTGLLVLFITVAFFAILLHVNRMVFGEPASGSTEHGALPATCVISLLIAAIPVVILGLYQPDWLHTLVTLATAQLMPVAGS